MGGEAFTFSDCASIATILAITCALGAFACKVCRSLFGKENPSREDTWMYEAHMWAGFRDHRLVLFLLIGVLVSRTCFTVSVYLANVYYFLATTLSTVFVVSMVAAMQFCHWGDIYMNFFSPPVGLIISSFLLTNPIERVWRFLTAFLHLRSMPDVLIVGQPKAGTKAVIKGLATLPYVDFCSAGLDFVPTESMYFHGHAGNFAFMFPRCYSMCFPTKIERYFTKFRYGNVAYVDSHTLSFKSIHLAKEHLQPDTKIVMCVRNPVNAFISYVKMMSRISLIFEAQGKIIHPEGTIDKSKCWYDFATKVNHGIENYDHYKGLREKEFDNGWDPKLWPNEWKSSIYWYCYIDHIEHLEKHFGKGCVKIVIQEDLCKDPGETLRKLWQELDMSISDEQMKIMVDELTAEAELAKKTQGGSTSVEIDPEAKERLEAFYEPFNTRLASHTGIARLEEWNRGIDRVG